MKTFAISGRYIAAPPVAEWRENLAQMLGAKPRRIGTWSELGLYGALNCMQDAGEKVLPQDAILVLSSLRGTYVATDAALLQIRDDLPMPLTFLQTQPSQLLAILAASLGWSGQAQFIAGMPLSLLLQVAAAQAGKGGILLGWVDEMAGGSSRWLRLLPCVPDGMRFEPVGTDEEVFLPASGHIRVSAGKLEVCRSVLNGKRMTGKML